MSTSPVLQDPKAQSDQESACSCVTRKQPLQSEEQQNLLARVKAFARLDQLTVRCQGFLDEEAALGLVRCVPPSAYIWMIASTLRSYPWVQTQRPSLRAVRAPAWPPRL